ncbi:hypothetical protein BZL30_0135 [Mycobacterium kansasii]|uniref:Uncharacterized protein n=1 Tax=Mycobacterium kansasii TaxID=1768 RepID=A0A1V3XTH1_MYCKA|nr:hypothetical protein BZL30_0135 [Mycobacterium kansasii]
MPTDIPPFRLELPGGIGGVVRIVEIYRGDRTFGVYQPSEAF